MREKYRDDLDRLNRVCTEFCSRMVSILNEQTSLRPMLDAETNMKVQVMLAIV